MLNESNSQSGSVHAFMHFVLSVESLVVLIRAEFQPTRCGFYFFYFYYDGFTRMVAMVPVAPTRKKNAHLKQTNTNYNALQVYLQ
jgi:hypothetical protein